MSEAKKRAYKLSVKELFGEDSSIFWDTYVDELNFVDNEGYIIKRVLDRIDDEGRLLDILDFVYPKHLIQWYCENSTEIYALEDIRVLSERYDVPKSNFYLYDYLMKDVVHV